MDDHGFTLRSKKAGLVIRAHVYRETSAPPSENVSLSLDWCSNGACSELPPNALNSALPPAELSRRELQSKAIARWGSWLHRDILSVVLLPDSAAVIVQLCHLPSKLCLTSTTIDGNGGFNTPPVRVGAHAIDHSYSQMFVSFLGLNVSIEYAVSEGGRGLDLAVTPQQGSLNTSDYAIAFAGRFAWGRDGIFKALDSGLSFTGTGLDTVELAARCPQVSIPGPIHPPGLPGGLPCSASRDCASERCTCDSQGCLGLCTPAPALVYYGCGFPSEGIISVGLSTNTSSAGIDDIVSRLDAARDNNAQTNTKFGKDLAVVVEGAAAAIGWRNVFIPSEAGSVLPVTFGFSWISPALFYDWSYVLFDWDNCMASLTAGVLGFKDAAYSNLIQIIKAKSKDGNVPNWYSGGSKSQQSEPAVGGRILLELFSRFGDTWIIDLLIDDLIDWSAWQWDRRRVVVAGSACCDEPGFISVGNDYSSCVSPDDCVGSFKGESGLDQSPKWDCIGAAPDGSGGDCDSFVVNSSRILQFGEAQSTSLFIVDAMAISALARIVNRTAEAEAIEARADAMRAQLLHLWDPSQVAFADVYAQTGRFSQRLSPTIFYPLMANASSAAQAARMVTAHLTNASEFCVSASWASNPEHCYWGLPSISANDISYMSPQSYVYWRGLSWGPMSLLVWWSLDVYRDDPIVRSARASLAAQKTAMFVDMWQRNRHVCENYSPFNPASHLSPGSQNGFNKSNLECTGWEFYHWGALNGLLSILERETCPVCPVRI